jgi:hypothetical protein
MNVSQLNNDRVIPKFVVKGVVFDCRDIQNPCTLFAGMQKEIMWHQLVRIQ